MQEKYKSICKGNTTVIFNWLMLSPLWRLGDDKMVKLSHQISGGVP
jgi:hypothetical protein